MHRYVCVDITVTIICQPNCSPDGLAVMEDVVRQHRQRDNSNEQCEYLPKISISYVHKTPPYSISYLAKSHSVRFSRVCNCGRLNPHYSGSQNQVCKLKNWCAFHDIPPWAGSAKVSDMSRMKRNKRSKNLPQSLDVFPPRR